MTLSEHAHETLRRLTERVNLQIDLALRDCGEDAVHDLRVSIRRLSQALRIFAELMPPKEARNMRRRLKPALDAAAVARDLDVGAELQLREGLPAAHALMARMRSDRDRAVLALIGRLYLLRSEGAPSNWFEAYDSLRPVEDDAASTARAWLPPLADEFFAAGRKTMLKASSPQRLHAFRLAAKRFRYTLELFAPFYGPVFRERLSQVREIQALLGKRQDCAVAAARLRPLAENDEAARGCLINVEARGAKLEVDFRTFWYQAFDAAGQALRWRRYLARKAPADRSTT
ncbi:MAG: CHAD domain-containing protein [Candidatus Solibacter usitatus]|nr:CHAD domain-containing protein [Candidatus Solibacter usitatus]